MNPLLNMLFGGMGNPMGGMGNPMGGMGNPMMGGNHLMHMLFGAMNPMGNQHARSKSSNEYDDEPVWKYESNGRQHESNGRQHESNGRQHESDGRKYEWNGKYESNAK